MPFATPYADTLQKGGSVANQGASVANSMMAGIQNAMAHQSDLAFKMQKLVQDDKYRKAQQELQSQQLMQQALQFGIKQKFAEDRAKAMDKYRDFSQNIAVANLGMASDKALREAEKWNIEKPALQATADATTNILNNSNAPLSLEKPKQVPGVDADTFNKAYEPYAKKLDAAEDELKLKYDPSTQPEKYVEGLNKINDAREKAQYAVSRSLAMSREALQNKHNIDTARNNLYELDAEIEQRKSLNLPTDKNLLANRNKLKAIVDTADQRLKDEHDVLKAGAKELAKTDPAAALSLLSGNFSGSRVNNYTLKNDSGKALYDKDGSPAINYSKLMKDSNISPEAKTTAVVNGIVNFTDMNDKSSKDFAKAIAQTNPELGINVVSQMLNNDDKYGATTKRFLSNMRIHHPSEYSAFKANFESSNAPTYQKKLVNEYEISSDAALTAAKNPGGNINIKNIPEGELKNIVSNIKPDTLVEIYKRVNELTDATKLLGGINDSVIKRRGYNQIVHSALTGSLVNGKVVLMMQEDMDHTGPIDLTQKFNFTVTDNQLKINKDNAFQELQDNKPLNYVFAGTIDNPESKKALLKVKSISKKIRDEKSANKSIGPSGYRVNKSGSKSDTKKLYKEYNKAVADYFKTLKENQSTLKEYTDRKTYLLEMYENSLSGDVPLNINGKQVLVPKSDIKAALYFLVGQELTQQGS